jgi:hypothetical protein
VNVINAQLPVVGSVNSHITNTVVPISGTVNVNSMPAINLSNTSTTPLFVDPDSSARSAVAAVCSAIFDANGSASCTLTTVPNGQILVVDTISCVAGTVQGGLVTPLVLSFNAIPVGGGAATSFFHQLALTKVGGDAEDGDFWGLTTQVRIYMTGSVFLRGQIGTVPNNFGGSMGCEISGHMVTP